MWKFVRKKTLLKIYQLLMEDYEEQLEELKDNRENIDYDEYRKKYMLIHNRFSAIRRKIKNIEQDDSDSVTIMF